MEKRIRAVYRVVKVHFAIYEYFIELILLQRILISSDIINRIHIKFNSKQPFQMHF